MKKFYLLSILITTFCLQNTFGQNSESSLAELVVEGNVLGYELNAVKSFNMDGFFYEYPTLFKITKVLEGEEKAQYIIVLLKPLTKEYAEETFGLDKVTTFRLVRRINYVKKIKELLHSGFTIENRKLVKTPQTFTFVSGIEKGSLPLKEKISCYVDISEITEF